MGFTYANRPFIPWQKPSDGKSETSHHSQPIVLDLEHQPMMRVNSQSRLTFNQISRNAVLLAFSCSFVAGMLCSGCESDVADPGKSLPPPLPETLPYEYHAKVFRVWGGDYFDMQVGQLIHYVCLEGIDSPKPGQPFYQRSREELQRIVGDHDLRLVVHRLDESKVAFVRAWAPAPDDGDQEIDVGLEMIKRGFGWYDGNSFEGHADYQQSEAKAREAKLGLWSQPNPVPPWDFNTTE